MVAGRTTYDDIHGVLAPKHRPCQFGFGSWTRLGSIPPLICLWRSRKAIPMRTPLSSAVELVEGEMCSGRGSVMGQAR